MRRKLEEVELELDAERQFRESNEFQGWFPAGIRYESFSKDKQQEYDDSYKSAQK